MLEIVRSSTRDKERDIQFQLNRLNTLRFNPRLPSPTWKDDISELARLSILEGRFLEAARKVIAYRAASAPANANQFLDWFEELKKSGPGQNDPLFLWLAEECSMEQMKWFLTQEVAGKAGFEDYGADAVEVTDQPKLELARNYWDEMGRGNPKAMHGPLRFTCLPCCKSSTVPQQENKTCSASALLLASTASKAANVKVKY